METKFNCYAKMFLLILLIQSAFCQLSNTTIATTTSRNLIDNTEYLSTIPSKLNTSLSNQKELYIQLRNDDNASSDESFLSSIPVDDYGKYLILKLHKTNNNLLCYTLQMRFK